MQKLAFQIYLRNLNASYSLGPVFWTVYIYRVQTMALVFSTSGEAEVKQSQEVEVTPSETYTPTEAGDYKIVVQANSEVNITGLQKDSLVVSVENIAPCSERPIRSPSGMVVVNNGTTITYTAPKGCCYVITPFINTGVFYSMTPTTPQTISDGQTATFTVTPKGSKPLASMVAFDWRECEKGTPRGKDYVVLTPNSGGSGVFDTTVTSPFPLIFTSLFGDPVSTSTGQFILQNQVDLSNSTSPLLQCTRSYDGGMVAGAFPGGYGPNWQHPFNSMIFTDTDVSVVKMHDGRTFVFNKSGSAWTPDNSNKPSVVSLQQINSSWLLTDVTYARQYTFDSTGRLTRIDDNKNPVSVVWTNGILNSASDKAGNSLQFVTDSLNHILSATNGTQTVGYSYTAKGELASVTYPDGRKDWFTYTANVGQLSSIRTSGIASPIVTMEYNAQNKVAKQTDALGKQWIYDWTAGKATLTDPDGVKEVHAVNSKGQVTTIGPVGSAIEFTYDNQGLPTTLQNVEGGSTSVTFHMSGRPESITTTDGTTRFDYTARTWNGATVYDCSKAAFSDGTSRMYQYDGRGLCIRITDEAGSQWNMAYDTLGNVTSITDAMGRVTKQQYDARGHNASMTLPDNSVTQFETNAGGLITKATSPGGKSRMYQYDAFGRTTSATNELGQKTSYRYDSTGFQIATTNAANQQTLFSRDGNNRLNGITNALGARVALGYSDAGRLAWLTDAVGAKISFAYDAEGMPLNMTGRDGGVTTYKTNADGYVITMTSPEQRTTTFEYDAYGRRTSVSLGLDVTYLSSYDNRGRLHSSTDADGRKTTFTYTPLSDVQTVSIGSVVQSTAAYDKSGLLTSVTDGEGGVGKWLYDAGGRCTSIIDPAGRAITYAYDIRGRVTKTTLPGALGSSTCSYDDASNLTDITYSDGMAVKYRYDGIGRVTSTTHDSVMYNAVGNVVYSNGIQMEYNANGWMTKLMYGPNRTINYTYDKAGRVLTIADWAGGKVTFTYDADGNLLSITRSNGTTTEYEYDDAGRMTNIKDGDKKIALSYGAGTRILGASKSGYFTASPTPGETSWSHDAGSACITHTPDALGRSTIIGGTTVSWNAASQVTEFSGALSRTFEYDGFGRLVKTVTAGVPFQVVWNDAFGDGLPSILRSQNTYFVVPTPGGTINYVIDSATQQPTFLHFDHQGNVVLQSSVTSSASVGIAYTPYGSVLGADGLPTVPFLFGGMTGVLALSNDFYVTPGRMYHAASARFLSPDPVRSLHPQRLNPFVYAYNDPVNWNDWSGRAPASTPSVADELIAASNRRFEEANRQTQQRYEEELRKIEEQAARRRAEREAETKRRLEMEERIRRDIEAEREEVRREHEALDKAQAKVRQLNDEVFDPPPPPPAPSSPTPGVTGGGGGLTGATPGGGGSAVGGAGQTPGSGTKKSGSGTQTRPYSGQPGGTSNPPSTGGNQPRPGATGSGITPGSTYGTFFPQSLYVAGSWISGFVEGFCNPWDTYYHTWFE